MIGPSRPPPVAGPSRPIGPQRPPSTQVESDEDDYTPALPPSHTAARPALPPDPDEEDSDDDVGPRPPPAGFSTRTAEEDAVAEFQAREERRRLQAEEDAKPKKLQREEWMLNPPTESELLKSMDPTKLRKRGFNASEKKSSTDTALWTETPEERIQRQADEVLGKRKKKENAEETERDEAERIAEERRRRRDREMRDQVSAHNSKNRNESLVDKHARENGAKAAEVIKAQSAVWDRDRDMGLGGRLMDEGKRKAIIKNSSELGGRFGGGSYL